MLSRGIEPMDEVFKPIDGWLFYEVSNLGRVRSLQRTVVTPQGVEMKFPERILKAHPDTHGYLRVALHSGKRTKGFTVHRLVLTTFVGPRPAGGQCRHLNGDKTDNRLENLAWGTARENTDDNVRHGVTTRSAGRRALKLNEAQAAEIKRLIALGVKRRAIAKQFGVNHNVINMIAWGQIWRRVEAAVEEAP
jgi:hypothetical protein